LGTVSGLAGDTSDVPMMGPNGQFVFGGVGMPPPDGHAGGTSNVSQPSPKGGPQTRLAKPATSSGNPKQPIEARSGKDKVPGKGSGTVDTQHAMLAPGEAVLNKAAAEYLGRATIDVLNHVGRIKMGLDTTSPAGDSSTHQQAVKPGKGQPSMPNEAGGEGMGFAEGGMFGPWGDARTMNAPMTPGGSVIGGSPNDPNSMMHTRPGIDFIAASGMTDTSFVPKPPIPGRPGGGGEMIPGFADGIPSVPAPGQTVTNGTWGPSIGNSGDSALRNALGLGVPRVINPPPIANAGNKPLPRFAGGSVDVPAAPAGASEALHPLLAMALGGFVPKPPIPGRPGGGGELISGYAGGATTVPPARDIANRKGGKSMSVAKPGSDVMDRWNTGLPMFAVGTSKVPAKGKGKGPGAAKGVGKLPGLTPGLMAALLGQGIGSPLAGIPGVPPGLGPSMQPPVIGMGR
jgi:hypothetical protein